MFSVNGIEMSLPVHPDTVFRELIDVLKKMLTTDRSMISSIHVDGKQVTTDLEATLASVPVSSLDSVEIFTLHPREIADETLQTLLKHLIFLESLSKKCGSLAAQLRASPPVSLPISLPISLEDKAQLSNPPVNPLSLEFQKNFLILIDGISTLTEAVHSVKKVFKMGLSPSIQVLEADLLSIMRDTLMSQNGGQTEYFQELLDEHLPKNLSEWRTTGIPMIMRSRDN
jgi:hypothetical protein